VPCVPIRVPDSICRRSRVYRIRAAGGLRLVAAPTAVKSIYASVRSDYEGGKGMREMEKFDWKGRTDLRSDFWRQM
jgi:hypothetical protein